MNLMLSAIPMLAAVDGEGMVRQLLVMLVVGICVLVVWLMGRFFLTKFGAPPIAMTIWNGLFVLLGGIVIINFLLSLIGHPMVKF